MGIVQNPYGNAPTGPLSNPKLKLAILALIFLSLMWIFYAYNFAVYAAVIIISIVSLFSSLVYIVIHRGMPELPVPKLVKYPTITILVPSFNSGKTLKRSVEAIRAMKYPHDFRVIVMDDASTDGSIEQIRHIKGVEIVALEKNGGKAAALNRGIKLCDTELIAGIDSDTYPGPDTLMKAVPYFYRKPNVGAVTVYITVANHAKNLLTRVQELEYYSSFGFVSKINARINGLMVTPGPMSIYRRDMLVKIGGYDESNITEDMEMGLRIQSNSYAIECCTDALVPTEVPETFRGLYRQRIRWFRGTIFNLQKYGHMMLDTRFGDFGIFSYPAVVVYVLFTWMIFSIVFFRALTALMSGLFELYLSASVHSIYF
ncbi:MAG TPA: glycosyltransferase family 2 protein, partial [Candidatus Micrarchaeota archaeon]|nr:glycosyltransferase family 2 protein [Candidatus Micrarchaeota archaeon]